MKLHYRLNRMMVAGLTATLLLTGSISTSMARDRGRHRRIEPKKEQHDQRKHDHRPSYRGKKHHRKHHHKNHTIHRTHQTRVVRSLPRGCRTFKAGHRRYYYHRGHYYRRHHHHGYEIVRAPRFRHLPRHARRVVYNRHVYYICDDIYYCYRGGYYEICEAPYVVQKSIEFDAGPIRIILSDSDYYY